MSENIAMLEKELREKKTNIDFDKTQHQSKIQELHSEISLLKGSNKIYEEKVKLIECEKNRLEDKYLDQIRTLKKH